MGVGEGEGEGEGVGVGEGVGDTLWVRVRSEVEGVGERAWG